MLLISLMDACTCYRPANNLGEHCIISKNVVPSCTLVYTDFTMPAFLEDIRGLQTYI